MAGFLERLERTPAAGRWALARRFMAEDPLAFYGELRAHRPVLALPELTLVTRFADCADILRRQDAFSVALYKPKQGDYWMAQDDTAEHWREKSIMRAILDREDVPRIRAWVAERAGAILDGAGGGIDAARDLARAIPLAMVEAWFGFDGADAAELADWSYWNQYDAFHNQPFDVPEAHSAAEIVAGREAANARMRAYLADLVRRRVGELEAGAAGNDPVSRLVKLSLSGALRFDMARVVLNAGGLLIGAVETTARATVYALSGLIGRPEVLAQAVAAAREEEAAGFDGYAFEALRFTPAFPYFFRTCEKPTLIAGGSDHATVIAPGTTVLALTHAAMFDAAAFPDPERFDPRRPVENMFHFGLGAHECLGRPISRVTIPEIVRQCLRRPGIRATGPVDQKGTPFPEAYPLAWD